MNAIDTCFEVASQFFVNPRHVLLGEDAAFAATAEKIANSFLPNEGSPIINGKRLGYHDTLTYELIANAVNYCYWYGSPDIRPNGANAHKMYELLNESFLQNTPKEDDKLYEVTYTYNAPSIISCFKNKLIQHRFPLLEQRINHLSGLLHKGNNLGAQIRSLARLKSAIDIVDFLVSTFPTYTGDIFIKRASLFVMRLAARGHVMHGMDSLPIPADYQVPKMLRHFDCLVYNLELEHKIIEHDPIPSGSKMECEIRAATILAGRKLANMTKLSPMVIDNYLWQNRKMCNDPFHLTVTTDY